MHYFRCSFVPSSTLHSLIFHSVTSRSNDSKLPYTRKNHRRTICSSNTQVLTSSTSHSSSRIDREFARVYLGSTEFCGAAALAVAYHALLRIPTRAETSSMTPRKYSVASETIYSSLLFIQVSFYSKFPPALSLSTIIWRYTLQFVNMDAKELLTNCGLGWAD